MYPTRGNKKEGNQMTRPIEFSVRLSAAERQMFHEVAERDGLAIGALMRNLVARRAQEQALPVIRVEKVNA
jgi:hypothetical protein